MSYHPNYFQQGVAVRNDCQQRLDAIKGHVKGGSLLDVGCSEGFYSFGLADRCGPILAIDKELSLVQKCWKIKKPIRLTSISNIWGWIDYCDRQKRGILVYI